MVPNTIIDHKQLSALSKYLLVYLLRQAPGWKTHDSVLRAELGVGRDKLELLFKELRREGYVRILPILGGGGRYLGSNREFSSTPLWLNQKPCKNQLLTEAPISRAPVDQGPGEPGLYVNNTIVNNINNNIQDTPRDPSPVDKSEELVCLLEKEFLEQVMSWGVNYKTVKSWVTQFGVDALRNKVQMLTVELSRGTGVASRGGWLKRALAENWQPNEVKKSSSKHYTVEETKEKLDLMLNYDAATLESARSHMEEIKKTLGMMRGI
jgi:hypothetical protein